MNDADSNASKKVPSSKPALHLVAYGLAMAETLLVYLRASCAKYLVKVATGNSSSRDTPPICRNSRERFVWAHGFISGVAIISIIVAFGLSITLWMALK